MQNPFIEEIHYALHPFEMCILVARIANKNRLRHISPKYVLFNIIIGVFAAVCTISPNWAGANETRPESLSLTVGAYENHPKIYKDSDGEIAGIFADILNEIARRENWRLSYIYGSWTECLERLEKNELDIMVDVAYSKSRNQIYAFNSETVLVNWGIIYTQRDLMLESLLDLDGKNVAVMNGSIHTDGEGGIKSLVAQFDIDCSFIEVDNYHYVFELLGKKNVDAGVVNRIFGAMFEDSYEVSPTSIIFNPRHLKFAFPKHSPKTNHLVQRIDNYLKEAKRTPESIYHQTLYIYLSNLPHDWLDLDMRLKKDKKIPLTERERAWIADHPVIRLGIDPEFAPFEYIGEDGSYMGIASDYIDLLNRRLGLNMVVQRGFTWKTVMEKVARKEVDVLPCVDVTEARRAYLNFSKPYLTFHRVIITRMDAPFLAGLEDLYGVSVAVQSSSSHEGYVKEHTRLDPVTYETLQEALLAVSNGSVDAFVGNIASSTYWIRKLNLANLKVAAPVSRSTQSLYIAARKDWPELVMILNKGISSITSDEMAEIRSRWVSVEYSPGISPRIVRQYLLQTIGAGCILLTLILVWNYGLKREIKTRREFEKALQDANQRLQELDRLKSMFIASMSHELRTPLNSIIGFSSIILNEWIGPLNEEQKENLSTVLRSGKHLLSLINDVIDVSKIEAGKLDTYTDTFDLNSILEEALTLFKKEIGDKQLGITVSAFHYQMITDRRRLLQCIVNIIGNAIKYTPQGTITVSARLLDSREIWNVAELAAVEGKAYVEITVIDTGVGIREEDAGKIFQPFMRLDSPIKSSVKGTGLGLYLTKKIITDVLNGAISVRSKFEKGTTVSIIIPAQNEPYTER